MSCVTIIRAARVRLRRKYLPIAGEKPNIVLIFRATNGVVMKSAKYMAPMFKMHQFLQYISWLKTSNTLFYCYLRPDILYFFHLIISNSFTQMTLGDKYICRGSLLCNFLNYHVIMLVCHAF